MVSISRLNINRIFDYPDHDVGFYMTTSEENCIAFSGFRSVDSLSRTIGILMESKSSPSGWSYFGADILGYVIRRVDDIDDSGLGDDMTRDFVRLEYGPIVIRFMPWWR